MNVYVMDEWEKRQGGFTGPERPWFTWCKSMSPCVWEGSKVTPLDSSLTAPGVVIVHWSYLRGKHAGDEEQKDMAATEALRGFVDGHPGFTAIVISGDNLGSRPGIGGKLYFRPIKVTKNEGDPFGVRYLGEFYRAIRGETGRPGEVDFTLLEPEPRGTLLAVARLVAHDLSVSRAQWSQAEAQCRRLVRRGDGREPLEGPHIDWLLSSTRWPANFLANTDSRRKFAEAVEAVLEVA